MTSESGDPRRPGGRARLAVLLALTAAIGVAASTALVPETPAAGTAAAADVRASSYPEPVRAGTGARDLFGSGVRRSSGIGPAAAPSGTVRPSPRPAAGSAPPAPGTPADPGYGAGTAVAAGGTFVAVGDSITAGVPAEGTVERPGPTSWLADPWLVPGRLVGGWARSGAVTADMRAAVLPTAADVLVLMGGTNDLARGIPWPETAGNLRAVAATVGAGTVLLSATPPSTPTPGGRTAFNARLAQLAADQGWHYVDPWTTVAADGAFTPGSSADGIHPTPPVARIAGQVIGAEMAVLYP